MEDLLDGFHEGRDAGIKYDDRNDHCTQIFDSPITEGVFLIRFSPCQLCADNCDQGASCVGKVIDSIQYDGDGVRQHAYNRLECCQKHIGYDADDTGSDNGFLSRFIFKTAFAFFLYFVHGSSSYLLNINNDSGHQRIVMLQFFV